MGWDYNSHIVYIMCIIMKWSQNLSASWAERFRTTSLQKPDGNCLFHALSYTITGCESQHGQVRHKVVNHLTTKKCWHLLENYTPLDDTLEEYVQRMCMHRDGVWGTSVEILAFSHLTGLNIASYNSEDGTYHFFGPAVIDPKEFMADDSRPGVYLSFHRTKLRGLGVHVCTLKLYIIMHVRAQYGGECFY